MSALRPRTLKSSLLTLAVTGPALALVAVATAGAAPASAAARPAIVASTSPATGVSAAASAGQAAPSALVRDAKPLAAASPPASAATTNGAISNGGPPHGHTGKPAKHRHRHRHRHLTPRQMAKSMLHNFGWRQRQFKYLNRLWNRESGWNVYAANPYSGAYGIPQAVPGSKMASAGKKWRTSARVQIRWGLRYISGRYGSPQGAWDHEVNTGWY